MRIHEIEMNTGSVLDADKRAWMQTSIRSLARYWDTPEEDTAWAYLQETGVHDTIAEHEQSASGARSRKTNAEDREFREERKLMSKIELPEFKSYKEEATFWDNLDTGDFMEDDGEWFHFDVADERVKKNNQERRGGMVQLRAEIG
jgi:hypothetical protein